MLRSLSAVLLFLSISAAATETLVVKTRDGEKTTIDLPDPTRVIVELAPNVKVARLRSDLAQGKQGTGEVILHEYSRLYHGASMTIGAGSIDRLRALPYVIAIHPDRILHMLSEEPGIAAVHAPEVWSGFDVRGKGITIAIIDTGIDYHHPALGGGFGPSFKVIGGHDYVDNDDDPMDENGHGTHVAGIVAANTAELHGVAPEATLIAYRVLDKKGKGSESNIIAALERAADPNGDGDPSDHVQVINLSLGGPGGANDPISRAVNAAVDAGIVVCAAAGNNGKIMSIDSPGAAEKAITVGATDGAQIAYFSSIGPSLGNYSIKPEVSAPGSNVRSSGLNGAYIYLSGTSMATPHIAGIAALLRQLHPDWTPAMIKQALTENATSIFGASVMAAGSGQVDALRAASAKATTSPVSLNFGVTNGSAAQFTQTRTLTVTNNGSAAQDFTFSAGFPPYGTTVVATPATINVPAGESRDVQVAVTLDNKLVPFERTFSRGGVIEVHAGSDTLRVPWAVVKGIRVRLDATNNGSVYAALLTSTNPSPSELGTIDENAYETLVKPGTYDLTVFGDDYRNTRIAYNYFATIESRTIDADSSFQLTSDDISRVVKYLAYDEKGTPLAPTPAGQMCQSQRTLMLPDTSPIEYLRVYSGGSITGITSTTLGNRYALYGGDVCRDNDLKTLRTISFPSVRGLTSDVQLTAGGSAMRGQRVSLVFPTIADGGHSMSLAAATYTPADRETFGFSAGWGEPVWNGTVFMEEITDPESATYPILDVGVGSANGFSYMQPAPLRFIGNRAASFASRPMPPLTRFWAADETMTFGNGFSMPTPFFYEYDDPSQVTFEVSYHGATGELRVPFADPRTRVFDMNGKLLTDTVGDTRVLLTGRVQMLIESDEYEVEGMRGKSALKSTFGGNGNDTSPPIFTSLAIIDGAEHSVSRLAARSAASILVSAMDYGKFVDSLHIREGSLTVSYRRNGTDGWHPLTTVKHGEDYGTNAELHRNPLGSIYDADLQEVTNNTGGYYDLRLTVEDLSGNQSELVLSPALLVDSSPPPRVRPVRR